MKKYLSILLLTLLASSASADFGDGGKWEMTPYGPRWDENDWPEFTPMYWMEEFSNEMDNDDDEDYYRYGRNGMGDGMPYRGWYDDDDNDWPEFTSMYWMEEFADEMDDDDDDYYRYGPGSRGGYYPGWDDDDNDWPEFTPMYWMEEFADEMDDDDDYWRDGPFSRFDRPGFDGFDGFPGGFDAPSFDMPNFDSPGFDSPSFDTPGFDRRSFNRPRFDAPRFDQSDRPRPRINSNRQPAPEGRSSQSLPRDANPRRQTSSSRDYSDQRRSGRAPTDYRTDRRYGRPAPQNYARKYAGAAPRRAQQSSLPSRSSRRTPARRVAGCGN